MLLKLAFILKLAVFNKYLSNCQVSVNLLQKEKILTIKQESPPMSVKKIKLNSLQNKTLALFQELANSSQHSTVNPDTNEVNVAYLPQPHGNHFHVGRFTVSSKDASGFTNETIWNALEKKGLAKSDFPVSITLTIAGLEFKTGLEEHFEVSDH